MTKRDRGLTDGQRASTSPDAGSTPAGRTNLEPWRWQFEAWWARNHIQAHQIMSARGFAEKVWKAAKESK